MKSIREKIEKEMDKDSNYVQLYLHKNLKDMVCELKGTSIKLFLYLSSLALEGRPKKTEDAFCVVSLDSISKSTHMTKSTIIHSTKELVEYSYIKVYKSGNTNVYAVNPNKIWKSSQDNKFKALYYNERFDGSVVNGNILIEHKPNKKENKNG